MQTITEGTTTFVTNSEKKITKSMPVFYNPVMKLNRDLSLLVLTTMNHPIIGLPMEASGVRAARIINELNIEPREIMINDISPSAIKIAKKNVKHERATFTVEDANVFLRSHRPFDYIDIDPFGTPNPFLDAACQAIKKNGILAVTATDTSALAGTYPRATARKYWATPSRTWVMHEIGLRILIRKVQLVAAQYGNALTPLISISTNHYYRIFFRCTTGVTAVKKILAAHGTLNIQQSTLSITNNGDVGPLWTGALHEKAFVKKLKKHCAMNDTFAEAEKLLDLILEECSITAVGFLDIHELASKYNFQPLKREKLFSLLQNHVARTHISPTGFKTDLPVEKVVKKIISGHTGPGAQQ